MKTCETCKWWSNCECHKNAPVVVDAHYTRGRFPLMAYRDWCGSWEGEKLSQGLVKSITLVVDGEAVTFSPDDANTD